MKYPTMGRSTHFDPRFPQPGSASANMDSAQRVEVLPAGKLQR
jgi:hypothetical protein